MQYNINVANGTGMEVRTNLNLAHQSLATNFFGATDPSLMSPVCAFPGSTWADTGNGLLKVRNADDSDWIVIGTIDVDGTPKLNATSLNLTATDVPNTPSGTISATNVQSAVNSLNVLPLLLRDTAYAVDDVAFYAGLPSAMYLQCTTAGTTAATEPDFSGAEDKGTVTDGTVVWTYRKLVGGSGSGRNVGDIFLHAGNGENPQGALLCDGSAVSRTMYPDLFEKIGTTYGAGDGSTTFNLPNLSDNRFVEGSTTAGTAKNAGLPNITGKVGRVIPTEPSLSFSGAFSAGERLNGVEINTEFPNIYFANFDASLSNPIYGNSTTVQPKSLTLRYFIQAFDGQTPDSALIDITQYAQELATKANRQLSNLDTANLACHVVVDSYYDSTTGDWWREYDDGWIEQGGKGTVVDGNSTDINLLRPYTNDKYTAIATARRTSGQFYWPMLTSVSNTTITIAPASSSNSYSSSTGQYNWFACGMGASV